MLKLDLSSGAGEFIAGLPGKQFNATSLRVNRANDVALIRSFVCQGADVTTPIHPQGHLQKRAKRSKEKAT